MKYLDENPHILQWASEELFVPYKSPLDGKWHRYFPDFIIRMKDKDGKISTKMIEIKPRSQSVPPTVKTNGSKPTKDRKSTRLNSSHSQQFRMPSSA